MSDHFQPPTSWTAKVVARPSRKAASRASRQPGRRKRNSERTEAVRNTSPRIATTSAAQPTLSPGINANSDTASALVNATSAADARTRWTCMSSLLASRSCDTEIATNKSPINAPATPALARKTHGGPPASRQHLRAKPIARPRKTFSEVRQCTIAGRRTPASSSRSAQALSRTLDGLPSAALRNYPRCATHIRVLRRTCSRLGAQPRCRRQQSPPSCGAPVPLRSAPASREPARPDVRACGAMRVFVAGRRGARAARGAGLGRGGCGWRRSALSPRHW